MDTMPTYQARYNRVAGSGMRRTNPNPAQTSMSPTSTTPSFGATSLAPSYLSPSFSPASTGVYASGASVAPKVPTYPTSIANPTSVGAQVGQFQNFAREGVQGYGDIAGQDFRKNVGEMLGNLNSIGALRSGGVTSGLNDLTTNYGRQIGDYAKMATQAAIGQGQEQAQRERELAYRQAAEARARRQSTLGTIGKIVGGVGGLLPGGSLIGKAAKVLGGVFGG